MKKKQAEPKFANAYEALAEVRRRILAEPENYFQDEVSVHPYARAGYGLPPACGAAHCVAGWFKVVAPLAGDPWTAVGLAGRGASNDFYRLCYADTVEGKPGTKAYARRGASRVAAFMRKWKTRLLATPVNP